MHELNLDVLEREGFLVVPEVVDPVETSELIAAVSRIEVGGAALDRGGSVYASRNLLAQAPRIRDLADSPPIRDLVEAVLGPAAFVVRGLLFDKTSEANWTVPWHQDLSIAVRARVDVPGFHAWTRKAGVDHVQAPAALLERMLTVRVHLDACGASDGPLRVIPGSHRGGRLGVEETRAWLARATPVACLVPSGGAVLMRPLILHASSPSERPTHRRVVHLEFAAESLPGGLDWFEADPAREMEPQ